MGLQITDADELELLDYYQLAAMLGVHHKTAREIVKSGDIPLVRLGERVHRVRMSDVKRYLNRGGSRANA